MIEKTLAIIKPNTKYGHEIIHHAETHGFTIFDSKFFEFSKEGAESFYKEHAGKDFYKDLIEYLTSGICRVLILSKVNAVKDWRELMIPIRQLYGTSINRNAVHGSDSLESAAREIELIFGE